MSPLEIQCEAITFLCATDQAEAFVLGLAKAERAKFDSAIAIVARSISAGRPPARRWQRVRGTTGLFEFKITPPGSRGPQLRMLCAREGSRVLLLDGITKKQRALPRAAIERAERLLAEYKERTRERQGARTGGRGKGR